MHPKRAFVLLSCAAFCLATASTSQIDKAFAQSKGDQMQGSATVGGQITSGAGQAAGQSNSKANAEKAEKESLSSESQMDMMKFRQSQDKKKKAMEMMKQIQQKQNNTNQTINQNR